MRTAKSASLGREQAREHDWWQALVVDTMRILGPKEGKRGESVLENIVYCVNTNFLLCK